MSSVSASCKREEERASASGRSSPGRSNQRQTLVGSFIERSEIVKFRSYLANVIEHLTNFFSVYSTHTEWGEFIREFFRKLFVAVPALYQPWTKQDIEEIINKIKTEQLDYLVCMESFNKYLNKVVVITGPIFRHGQPFNQDYVITVKFENPHKLKLRSDLFVGAAYPSRNQLFALFRAADNGYALADQRLEQAIADATNEYVAAAGIDKIQIPERQQLVGDKPVEYSLYGVAVDEKYEDELCLQSDQSQCIDVDYKMGLIIAARLHIEGPSVNDSTVTHELELVETNPMIGQHYVLTLRSKNGEFTVILRTAWLGPSTSLERTSSK